MFDRKTIAAIVIAAAGGAATPALADDADARVAARQLEEARAFGDGDVRGTAAGEIARERAERRADAPAKSADAKRWAAISKAQSLN